MRELLSEFIRDRAIHARACCELRGVTRVGNLGSPAANKGRSEERAGCVLKGKTSWYSGWLFMCVVVQPAGLCCRLFVSRLGNLPPG